MSSHRVYRRSRRWYVDFTNHTGERVRQAAPEARTKGDAEEQLSHLLHEASMVRQGYKDALDNSAKLADLVEGFLLHKLATRRYPTVAGYRVALAGTLGTFRDNAGGAWPPEREAPVETIKATPRTFHPGPLGIARVEELTSQAFDLHIEARRQTAAIATLNKAIVVLKALLDWARKAGRIKTNPLADAPRAGKPAIRQRALEVWEVERLLNTSPEPCRTI